MKNATEQIARELAFEYAMGRIDALTDSAVLKRDRESLKVKARDMAEHLFDSPERMERASQLANFQAR